MVERRVRDVGNAGWPMLTKTNYDAWSSLMRVVLGAWGLLHAVDDDDVDEQEDLMATEAICKAVPTEMVEAMANKGSAKAAWKALRTANLGVERVRKAKAHTLRRDFDALVFKEAETIDGFVVRIDSLVQQLKTLGDDYPDSTVVWKFLQALPPKYYQIAMSIETLLDLDSISVEELIGRRRSAMT